MEEREGRDSTSHTPRVKEEGGRLFSKPSPGKRRLSKIWEKGRLRLSFCNQRKKEKRNQPEKRGQIIPFEVGKGEGGRREKKNACFYLLVLKIDELSYEILTKKDNDSVKRKNL